MADESAAESDGWSVDSLVALVDWTVDRLAARWVEHLDVKTADRSAGVKGAVLAVAMVDQTAQIWAAMWAVR